MITSVSIQGVRYHIVASAREAQSCQRNDSHVPVSQVNVFMSRVERSLEHDIFTAQKIRSLLERYSTSPVQRLDEAGIARRLGDLVRSGRLRIIECRFEGGPAGPPRGGAADSADSQQDSAAANSGTQGGSGASSSDSKVKGQVKTWVAVELIDDDDAPMMFERYIVKLPDGTTREGRLDGNGRVRFNGIDPGSCEITFPDFHSKEWRPA